MSLRAAEKHQRRGNLLSIGKIASAVKPPRNDIFAVWRDTMNKKTLHDIDVKGKKAQEWIKKNGEKVNLNGSIIFYAKKNIFIGEELLYDYGVNYNNILK